MAEEKTTAIALPKDKAARQAIAEMNEPLRKLYEGLVVKLNRLAESGIWHHYHIGKAIEAATVGTGKTRQETYGEKAAQKLSQALGIPEPTLYEMRKFAMAFEKDQLKKLLERDTRFGGKINYSCLCEIARESGANRVKMIAHYFTADPTPSSIDLRAWAQHQFNQGKSRGNRNTVAPKSPEAGLKMMDRTVEEFLRIQGLVSKTVFDRLHEEAEKYATQATLDRLLATEERLSQVKEKCDEDLRRTSNAIQSLTQQLQAKEQDGAVSAPTKKAVKKKVSKRGAIKTAAPATTPKKKKVLKKVVKKKTAAAPVRPSQSINPSADALFAVE